MYVYMNMYSMIATWIKQQDSLTMNDSQYHVNANGSQFQQWHFFAVNVVAYIMYQQLGLCKPS